MSRLIAVAIKERKVTLLLSLFIILYGLYAYYYLPRQENPDTSSPAVQIVTIFPGASAKDVEQQLTIKIEDEVAALDGVDWVESFSQDNASIVFGLLENGIDYETQWDKLREGIDNIALELPEGAEEPQISTNFTESQGLIISMSSSEYDAGQLVDYAERIKAKLAEVNGVKRVKIEGEKERRITIKIDEKALHSLDVSIVDVYNVIRAQNVVIPPGAIVTENGKVNLQVPQELRSVANFEDIIVAVSEQTGAVVRLKDIADISFDYDEGELFYTKDGRSAILLTATFKDDQNVVLIGNDVRAVIDDIR
ncbi:MAG: transporter, partial [Clostridiales bacterium]